MLHYTCYVVQLEGALTVFDLDDKGTSQMIREINPHIVLKDKSNISRLLEGDFSIFTTGLLPQLKLGDPITGKGVCIYLGTKKPREY